jgi:hypothetical protein
MKLKNAKEFFELAPEGRHRIKIVETEAKTASSGAPMIAITVEIREGSEFDGQQSYDNMITSEEYKGAGFGKRKLRGLGIDVEREVADEQIATELLGRELWANFTHEQMMDKNPATGKYDIGKFYAGKNGEKLPSMKLVPTDYFTTNTGAAVVQSQTQVQAPIQNVAPIAQVQAPVQYAQPVQTQLPIQNQGQFAQPQFQGQQFQGFPQQGGFANGGNQAVPPWAMQNQGQAPIQEAATGGKRVKKTT